MTTARTFEALVMPGVAVQLAAVCCAECGRIEVLLGATNVTMVRAVRQDGWWLARSHRGGWHCPECAGEVD